MYCGRFAPSPTGPLHFGSLVTALASALDARARGGQWLVRIEDVDTTRTMPGAAESILATLRTLGFEPDGPVRVQSQSECSAAYESALARLAAQGRTFPCACTRREIADSALVRPGGETVYPGTCRHGMPDGRSGRAIRVRVPDVTIGFDDIVQGRLEQALAAEVGDFVVKRADGLFAYQLAVVVDDAAQGVTHVVRGADLLDSTPRQILLQRLLGLPTPAYLHVPVALDAAGEKLSKQTLAAPIDPATPLDALRRALAFLGQDPPRLATVSDFWTWAIGNWRRERIPEARTRRI